MIEDMSKLVLFIRAIAAGTTGCPSMRTARRGTERAKLHTHQILANIR